MNPDLRTYHRKRHFEITPEPAGRKKPPKTRRQLTFVIQKHAARRLHYDFRLELEGVLKSWAVPKGPPLEPGEKRLAVHVEDHPLEYGNFEGEIPRGIYGAGTVAIWDRGTWIPEGDPVEGYRKGHLRFRLEGKRLSGTWNLVAMHSRDGTEAKNWLLIKSDKRPVQMVLASPKPVRPAAPASPDSLSGARRSPMPEWLDPQRPVLSEKPPLGDDWIHEVKFDGYRILAHVDGGSVRLLTRERNDWTRRFPSIASGLLKKFDGKQLILDGEVVVLNEKGISDFQALQNLMNSGGAAAPVYYLFDLLYADGYDLRSVPLISRKDALGGLGDLKVGLQGQTGIIRYAEHIEGRGKEIFEQACRRGLEGIVSKQKDSQYQPGRSKDWSKVKCLQEQEFVIGGYTNPEGSRSAFGALLLGLRNPAGRLDYVGRVGTGFSSRSLKEISKKLEAIGSPKSPFAGAATGRDGRHTHWVRPELVAEVAFSGWTKDRVLRQPSFHGLREDKPASKVTLEEPQAPGSRPSREGGLPIRLSNPDRVLYPRQGITKRDLADFYQSIADWILPHIIRRPLPIVRCPSGHGAGCFFQKHLDDSFPKDLHAVPIVEKGEQVSYFYVEDIRGLLSLVQIGALELHPWGSTIDSLEHPDLITFDLDPAPDIPWERVIEAARDLRQRLKAYKLESFAKTTGGKGLHVVVPIEPNDSWDRVKEFSKQIAQAMARDSSGLYTSKMSKSTRVGKVFIDYLRNSRGATAIAAYSTRARPGAPVAVPISWDELKPSLKSDSFTVFNLREKLAKRMDPWPNFAALDQVLPH